MIRTVLVLLSTARRLRLGPCTPLGSGGEAQLMRWARSLQVVTCSWPTYLAALEQLRLGLQSILRHLGWLLDLIAPQSPICAGVGVTDTPT